MILLNKKGKEVMKKYLPLEPLLAEIERRIAAYQKNFVKEDNKIARLSTDGRIQSLKELLSFLNTLVKEVDLEKEIEEHVVGMPMSEFTHESEVDDYWDWAREEFRHFFELGLKAQKGE